MTSTAPVLNPAFLVERENAQRRLVNNREGLQINLTDALDAVITQAIDGIQLPDGSPSDALEYLLRLRVLVDSQHRQTAAGGVSRVSAVPVGRSWVSELQDLASWVVVGCDAAFGRTEFGNPGAGMLAVRRGLQRLLRPAELWSYDTNTTLGLGSEMVLDFGDIIYESVDDRAIDVHERLRFATRQIVRAGGRQLSVGGDHSLTYPTVSELVAHVPDLRVLHLDAHSDRRPIDHADPRGGQAPDCGNFIEHLIHDVPDLPILTVGVRGWTAHHLTHGRHYRYVTAQRVGTAEGLDDIARFCDNQSVYLSVDIDVLDPSVAPEVAHPSPAGLSLPQLQQVIATMTQHGTVVGADFVEVCESRSSRNLAALAQVCAIAALLDTDRNRVGTPATHGQTVNRSRSLQ